MPVLAAVVRNCPKCREQLTLSDREAKDGTIINCPICRRKLRVSLQGIFNRHIELEKVGIFG